MEEGLIYIGVFALGLIILAIQAYRSRKQSEELLRKKIKNNWGNIPDRQYDNNDMNNISNYYRRTRSDSYFIDDITWNDLNMDSVFVSMNNTYSSLGEEYLYKMLREPKLEGNFLEQNEKIVSYFENHPEKSQEIQCIYAGLGRTKSISLYEFLYRLMDLGKRSNIKHYVMNVLLLMSLGILLVSPATGILMLMVVVGINVISYFSDKAKIESYFICFRYLVSMIVTAEKLIKSNRDTDELKNDLSIIQQYTDVLHNISRGSSYIIGNNMSGSLGDIIMDYVRMICHIDLIKFNSMLNTTVNHTDDIKKLFAALGRIEACIAIASFRKQLPEYCLPEFVAGDKTVMMFEDIYHPCIENAVTNDMSENKCVLITGSNASGKSTFLKTVAINAIMAQTINTCSASKYMANFFEIYSSMALRDDLQNNESYYIVEIKSLKRIADKVNEGSHILCFVDEVLRGTNTIERIAASAHILKYFSEHGIMCFAATHDVELTYILEDYYSNYHFQESVEENDIIFNYKLYEGKATSRNAIKLLELLGYDLEITNAAEKSAADFVRNGHWTKCY